jgi:hypothetical protein
MFAKAAAKRRQNLLISVAHSRSMLDRNSIKQLHDLEPIHNNQLSDA